MGVSPGSFDFAQVDGIRSPDYSRMDGHTRPVILSGAKDPRAKRVRLHHWTGDAGGFLVPRSSE
jgi:hypothetical protein